jgi:Spy/CpxP family protein refolding chaperone
MKRLAMVGLSAVLVVLALGTVKWAAGQAEGRPHWGMAGPGHEAERLLAMLDSDRVKGVLGLTDEQATRLHQITVETEKAAIKTKADLAVRRIELRELLKADNPDRDTVMKKVQEVSALTGQLMQQHVQALLNAKTILTPEQQKKLREFRASQHWGHPGMQGMGARHPGMRGGPGRPPIPPSSAPQPPAQPQEPPVQ